MPHDAFISYSTHDKVTADATCARLEAAEIRCWIAPRDITPGKEWGEAIVDAINQCRVMILIFSESANASPQIHREVERAVNKGVPVLPLRIEDIVPGGSLEYFIGSVHWLDALTPPLEEHLRRLVDAVKALLEIKARPLELKTPPSRDASPAATHRETSPPHPSWRGLTPVAIGLAAGLAVAAIGVGGWFLTAQKPAQTTAPGPAIASAPPQTAAQATIDPAVVGTLIYAGRLDDYDTRVVNVISADGTYHLVATQDEEGTADGGDGKFRTVSNKTGRVRTGTYRAINATEVEVTTADGTVVYRPQQPGVTVDPANPVMLGVWQATLNRAGINWTAMFQNNSDHTFHFAARAEDSGLCRFADQQWHCVSTISGRTDQGTYQAIDAHDIKLTGSLGTAVWKRQ